MKTFEEIQTEWAQQKKPDTPDNGYKSILKKVRFIRKKQRIMNLVLSITILVLITFFIYLAAYRNSLVAWSLVVMITSLLFRIGLELDSLKKLKKLSVDKNVSDFKGSMVNYYKNRVRIHSLWTPILLLSYSVGFVLLLPSFKANLSIGFYRYIIISAPVILIILSVFIFKQIKHELATLRELKNE